jgi:hypothetical protein
VTDVLSIGYVTLLEAAEMLQPSMFAGVPDQAVVIRLRQMGVNVRDGLATDHAIAEIWKAVDAGAVRAMIVGGRPRRIVRLDPAITKQIPILRSPRGRGFTFLGPSNPAFHQLAGWFGPGLSNITLAFRQTEIQKLAHRLRRTRRRMSVSDGAKKRSGRPSRQAEVRSVICEIVESRKWNSLMGVKALTRFTNRVGKWLSPVSEDTVARALDQLHEDTQDRCYRRVHRIRR